MSNEKEKETIQIKDNGENFTDADNFPQVKGKKRKYTNKYAKAYTKEAFKLLMDDYSAYFAGDKDVFVGWQTRYKDEVNKRCSPKKPCENVLEYFTQHHIDYINELRDKAAKNPKWMAQRTLAWKMLYKYYALCLKQHILQYKYTVDDYLRTINTVYESDSDNDESGDNIIA